MIDTSMSHIGFRCIIRTARTSPEESLENLREPYEAFLRCHVSTVHGKPRTLEISRAIVILAGYFGVPPKYRVTFKLGCDLTLV